MNTTSQSARAASRRRGNSALEMLGVFAILSILFAIVAESAQRRIRAGFIDAEVSTLNSFAEALERGILRSRRIPDGGTTTNGWLDFLSAELAWTTSQVRSNSAGNRRLMLVDPGFAVAANNSGATPAGPPWSQSVNGTSLPANARVLFISSLGLALPSSGSLNFNTLWDTADGQHVIGSPALDKDDVIVKRVDLKNLFVHVALNVNDRGDTARYSLDGGTTTGAIIGPCPFHFWALRDTPLSLYGTDNSVQYIDVLRESLSYAFERGRWLSTSVHGIESITGTFATAADSMANSAGPPVNPRQYGAKPAGVLNETYAFMVAYRQWIAAGRPTGNPGNEAQRAPAYRALCDAQQRLADLSLNLQTP